MTSVSAAGTPARIASISACRSCFPWKPSGHAIGGDDALVDAPGRFDLGMIVRNNQGFQPVFLLVGKQILAGVQGPPGGVERVPGPSAVRDGVLLHALTALVQGIAGKPNDVKRAHDLDGVSGNSSAAAVGWNTRPRRLGPKPASGSNTGVRAQGPPPRGAGRNRRAQREAVRC